jgi:hypothetical protein
MAGPATAPWRASAVVVDGVTLLAVVVCIPFAIIAVGLPVALGVKLVLWMTGQL